MAVNVGQRNVPDTPSNKKCYAVDACQHLCRYVLLITKSPKVMQDTQADLALRIRDLSINIYSLVFVANKIDTRTKNEKKLTIRIENQETALHGLFEMLGLIPVISSAFKWRKKKRQYWTKLVKSAIELVKAWNASDVENLI